MVTDDLLLEKVIELVKDRCTLLPDFYEQAKFFFITPISYDEASVKPKWDEAKKLFFDELASKFNTVENFTVENIELIFKELVTEKNIKPGELQMILRVMLVGSKIGPGVFVIAETIGKDETIKRITNAIKVFSTL